MHPTSHEIFQVQSTSPTGCRLKSLLTGDLVTKDIGLLRPLQSKDLVGTLGLINFKKGTFAENIYKRGSQIPLLPRSLPGTINNTPAILVQQGDHTSDTISPHNTTTQHHYTTPPHNNAEQTPHPNNHAAPLHHTTTDGSQVIPEGEGHHVKLGRNFSYDTARTNAVMPHTASVNNLNQTKDQVNLTQTPLLNNTARYVLRNRKIFNFNLRKLQFNPYTSILTFNKNEQVSLLQNAQISKECLKNADEPDNYKTRTKIKLAGTESLKCWHLLLTNNKEKN